MPLKNCDIDPNAFIEITIKTNSQEVLNAASRENFNADAISSGSGSSASPISGMAHSSLSSRLAANNQLGHIEERSSEDGFKEGIDHKEYLYKQEVNKLESRINDIKRITELTQSEVTNILNQNDNSEQKQQLIAQKKAEIEHMEGRENQLTQVLNILIDDEKTLGFCLKEID